MDEWVYLAIRNPHPAATNKVYLIYNTLLVAIYKEGIFLFGKILKADNLKQVKILVVATFFASVSLVCGKFLAFSIGDTLRFSFENLPLILVGMLFGPTVGALTAVTADIIGCILRGYAINPILTLAAALIGFLAGVLYEILKRTSIYIRVSATVIICHILGSVFVKTVGLCIWYSTPFLVTLLQRSINYAVVSVAELIILIIILKNKAFISQINKITGNKNEL